MFLRRRTQPKSSSHKRTDENERLLSSTIELEDHPTEAIMDASPPPTYTFAEVDASCLKGGEHQSCPHEAFLLRKRFRRVGNYVHDPIRRLQRQRTIVQDNSTELDCRDGVKASFEPLSGKTAKGNGRPWRAKSASRSDVNGLREELEWYFWSPTDIVKNCPTLEFLRIHLAPPSVWL